MSISVLTRIQGTLVALIAFITILISSTSRYGLGDFSASLGSLLRYVTIFFSIVLIIRTKRVYKYIDCVFKILLVFLAVYILQKKLTPSSTLVDKHIFNFIIIGIGAFTIGYSLSNIERYLKVVGPMSILVGLFFILEPITHTFLGKSSMETGYTLLPLCVLGLLYSLFTRNRLVRFLAMLPCVSVILFTSRGCGLTIIIFFVVAYIRKNRLSISKSLLWSLLLVFLGWIVFSYVLTLNVEASEGSFLAKFLSGDLTSANGRDELTDLGWALVNQYPLTGLGIDGEIVILEQVVRDYPFIHNVVIEFFIDYGIPVALILFVLYFTPIVRSIKSFSSDSAYSLLIIALLCNTWIRLLFSDTYCNVIYDIMLLFGFALSYKSQKYYPTIK